MHRVTEIRDHWLFLNLLISEDHDFKVEMCQKTLSYTNMRALPDTSYRAAPLSSVFDTLNSKVSRPMVITSYETHKYRTVSKDIDEIPGVPYTPPPQWRSHRLSKEFQVLA